MLQPLDTDSPTVPPMQRRSLLRTCAGFSAFALVAELGAAQIKPAGLPARAWVSRQRELAHGLKAGTLSQLQWCDGVNALASELQLEDLAAELRRARIKSAGPPFGNDPQKRFVALLDDEGQTLKLGYGLAVFDFTATSVITPHAHQHMVSAHLVIDGRVRVRTFDRVADESAALIIRPTADLVADVGHASAMTTPKNNVHWFAPRSVRAMTLDVTIEGLDAGQHKHVIQPVDPLGGKQLADGTIRASLISFERSMALYTARD